MGREFNEAQERAINSDSKRIAVIASAGSGKSTVLTHRVKRLVDSGVNPETIMVSTFSRKSAEDLTRKLNDLGVEGCIVGTFHSICAGILSKEGINVSKKIPQYKIDNELKNVYQGKKINTGDILSYISYQKAYNKGVEDEFIYKESDYMPEELRGFYRAYNSILRKEGAYDFDDYLIECKKLLQLKPNKYNFAHVMIDEFQDNNLIQNDIMKLLAGKDGNIFTVFDAKQSLYAFRGSLAQLAMDFAESEDTETIIMNTNYRSDIKIIDSSNKFVKMFHGKSPLYADAISSSTKEGNIESILASSKQSEAEEVANRIEEGVKNEEQPRAFAVLYRNNNQSAYVEAELKKRNIPYSVDGNGSFFQKKEMKLIMAVLRLIENSSDNSAYEEILQTRCYPVNYLKKTVLNDIIKTAGEKGANYLEASLSTPVEKPFIRQNLRQLVEIIERLTSWNDLGKSLNVIVDNIIKSFQLKEFIDEKYNTQEEKEDRWESLDIFKSFIKNNTLESFIRFVYTDQTINKKKAEDENSVKLMTIHKSKGLEFNNVFLIGVDEGKLPSKRELDIINEVNAFYVASTRARNNFYISASEPSEFFFKYIEGLDNTNKN